MNTLFKIFGWEIYPRAVPDIEDDDFVLAYGEIHSVLMAAFTVEHLAGLDFVVFVFASRSVFFGEFGEPVDLAF